MEDPRCILQGLEKIIKNGKADQVMKQISLFEGLLRAGNSRKEAASCARDVFALLWNFANILHKKRQTSAGAGAGGPPLDAILALRIRGLAIGAHSDCDGSFQKMAEVVVPAVEGGGMEAGKALVLYENMWSTLPSK